MYLKRPTSDACSRRPRRLLDRRNVLVNNAGVFKFEPLEAITGEDFLREFDTNVPSQIHTIQKALKHFPASGGSIINIRSITSENPVPNSSLYSATKGAVDTLATALAKEPVALSPTTRGIMYVFGSHITLNYFSVCRRVLEKVRSSQGRAYRQGVHGA